MESILISVCVDCLHAHANGEPVSETPDREPLSLIGPGESVALGMDWSEHTEDCPNRAAGQHIDDCECEQLGFSWSACHGCSSALGGDRYAMTVFRD